MFTSFIREAEEYEEKKGAENCTPSAEFERDETQMIGPPQDGRNQVYSEPIEMRVSPTYPRLDGARSGVQVDSVRRDGGIKKELDSRQEHETEITVYGEGMIGREELTELSATSHESLKSKNYIYKD